MRKCLLGLLVITVSLAAQADYAWEFTRGLEGWSAEAGQAWGVKGVSLSWEEREPGDGMAVFTAEGGDYPDGFEPRMHMFFWNGVFWNAAHVGVDGGPTGRYCVMRYRIVGTRPSDGGSMEYVVQRYKGGESTTTRALGEPALGGVGLHVTGDWVNVVIELDTVPTDPVERVMVQLGSTAQGSQVFFPDAGDRIEIDWIRFVDDATPYLAANFNESPWLWRSSGAFEDFSVDGGRLHGTFPTVPEPGNVSAPALSNDFVFLRTQGTAPELYVNTRYEIRCGGPCGTPSLPGLFRFTENPPPSDGDLLPFTLPTNGVRTVNLPLHTAPGWGTGGASPYATGTWTMDLGGDGVTGNLDPAFSNATIAFDWISFSHTPQTESPVFVPDLFGLSPEEAAARLGEVNLAVGETIEVPTVQTPVGTVLSSVPPAESWAYEGDAIVLHIAAGPLPEAERVIDGALTVVDGGRLARDGLPLRAVGANFFSMFSRTLDDPGDRSYVEGLQTLAHYGIPFVRFMAGGFWPTNMTLYLRDKEAYFALMDGVVAAAEDARVGLIPSVCWYDATVSDLMGEPRSAWGDPNSATIAFMRRYTEELVLRYRNSPALWAWELGNEYNLSADLPNAATHRPVVVPHLGTPDSRSEADDMTHDMWIVAYEQFGEVIRAFDGTHPITTGNSAPRPSQYHQRIELSWTQDSRGEYQQNLIDVTPDPLNLVSIHYYPGSAGPRFNEGVPSFADMLGLSAEAAHGARRAFLLGEFGYSDEDLGGDAQAIEQHFRADVADIVNSETDLAAVWVFDLPSQSNTGNITATNHRAYMLEVVGQANDTDRDGINNFDEVRGTGGFVTDPYDADTDNGGVPDGEEVARGTNPLDPGDDQRHATDTDLDGTISLSELLRTLQLYHAGAYHCDAAGEDGYAPGAGDRTCPPHSADYGAPLGALGLSEVLRVVQLHHFGAYHYCPGAGTDDGFCAGAGSAP